MIDEKNSVDMVDQKKAPIHLSTIDGDVSLENLVIEDRERKEKALVRKVDIRMMPLMMLLYILNYLDRYLFVYLTTIITIIIISTGTISRQLVLVRLRKTLVFMASNTIQSSVFSSLVSTISTKLTSLNFTNRSSGYILTQVPTNMILDKMRPSIFLPAIMCMWATVSTCTGAVQSYSGMVVLRFFLGFVEAPFFRKISPHHDFLS
jgi:hypothetical protein